MQALGYRIYLDTPLLVTAELSDPNSVQSYSYIPGSTLRGLFVQRYLQRKTSGAGDVTFRRLFLSGTVRYLNGYLVHNEQRTLPTPHALHRDKYAQTKTTRNFAVSDRPDEGRWQPLRKPYLIADNEGIVLVKPSFELDVHVWRDPVMGRAWIERSNANHSRRDDGEARGAVFRYEALATGQTFEAMVLVDDDTDLKEIELLLGKNPVDCRLGRSRSAGYGQATIERLAVEANWTETPSAPFETNAPLTLTLLSDAILRDACGTAVDVVDSDILTAYLGAPVELVEEHSFTSATITGGFNCTWELPVDQAPALAAGSVICVRLKAGAALDTAALTTYGIGERRVEGFGRVAINWLTAASYTYTEPDKSISALPTHRHESDTAGAVTRSHGATAKALAKTMVERLHERQVDERIALFAQYYVWPQVRPTEADGDRMPSNSQLGRLRAIVRRALPRGDTTAVSAQFHNFRRPARQAYERARLEKLQNDDWMADLLDRAPDDISSIQLDEWIERLLGAPQKVWKVIEAQSLGGTMKAPTIAGQQFQRDDTYNRTVALQLIDAVLAAPGQRRKNVGAGKEE
jgi:CRISPR-associated protein Csx10